MSHTRPIADVRPAPEARTSLALHAAARSWIAVAAIAGTEGLPPCLVVTAGVAAVWPPAAGVAALVAGGVEEVVVADGLELHRGTAIASLQFIRFLRDCESYSLRVHWSGRLPAALPYRLLTHLRPSAGSDLPGRQAGTAAAGDGDCCDEPWHYNYGSFYWRQGPGFLVLRDSRPDLPAQRLTLDDPARIALFLRLQAPVRVARSGAGATERAALQELVGEGIVLEIAGWAVSLPIRIRTWPVPYTAI